MERRGIEGVYDYAGIILCVCWDGSMVVPGWNGGRVRLFIPS
jgi:hypothetical protein